MIYIEWIHVLLSRTQADEVAVVCTLLSNFWGVNEGPQLEIFKWNRLYEGPRVSEVVLGTTRRRYLPSTQDVA